jgi:uncharacterized membrane protein YsdA (DUF1294 family)
MVAFDGRVLKGPLSFHGIAMIGRQKRGMDITDTSTQLLLGVGLLLGLANGLSLLSFGIDKGRAARNERRIPEAFLLKLAFLGGWPGAKLGQRVFRHKTQKQPFRTRLNLIGAFQVACVAVGFGVMHAPTIDFDQMKGMAMAAIAPTPVEEVAEAPVMPRRFGPGSDKPKAGISRSP